MTSTVIMQFYPQELITPPLTLVALLGKAELHSAVGEFLRAQYKPPINSVGLADPQHASRLFGKSQRCYLVCAKAELWRPFPAGEQKQSIPATAAPLGILKASHGPSAAGLGSHGSHLQAI